MTEQFLSEAHQKLSILDVADRRGSEVALIFEGHSYTYNELAILVQRELDQWPPGLTRVGLRCSPTLHSLIRFYAVLAKAAPTLLVHPRWTESYAQQLIERTGVNLFLDEDSSKQLLPLQSPPLFPGATLLMTTSGSSGVPKIVQHSHETLVHAAAASERNLSWQMGDRWLLSLPFSHIGGATILIRCLLAGVPVVARWGAFSDHRYLEQIESDGATLYSLVPTQLHDLVESRRQEPASVPSLRWALVGGAKATLALRRAAGEQHIPALFTYGMTEAGSQVATQPPLPAASSESTELSADVGYALPGIDLRLDDSGRVFLRGPNLMLGYLGGPSLRAPGEEKMTRWYETSDRAEFLPNGRLRICGRLDNILISGGENVDPEEVEATLCGCECVAEVAVTSLLDQRWGQKIVAILKLVPGWENAEALQAVQDYSAQRLPSYCRPKEFVVVMSMPLTELGKLDRQSLVQYFGARDPRDSGVERTSG